MGHAKGQSRQEFSGYDPRTDSNPLGNQRRHLIDIEATDSRFVVLRRVIPEEEQEGRWDSEMDTIMEEVKQAWKTWKFNESA